MSLLQRSVVTGGGVSTKGVFYSLFLLALVVSLFFIPEIVRFQDSVTSRKSVPVGAASSVNLDELIPDEQVHPVSSLDRVLMMINAGYLEKKEELTGGEGAVPRQGALGEVASIEDRIALERALGANDISWDQLTTQAVKRSFKSAQDAATNILVQLPDRSAAVRFALINYINGLGWIVRADQKVMSAEEAIAYIEQLDINVTQAMLTHDVDAVDYNNWKKVSLGPLVGTGKAASFKESRGIAFNPRLTLMKVEIGKEPDYELHGDQWVLRDAPSRLEIGGFVMGKDVKKVVIYRNGRRITEVGVDERPLQDGVKTFRFGHDTAKGVFTFRAISQEGESYDKSYIFLPKLVGRFPQDEQGVFLLPFGNKDFDDIALKNLDTRLDRYFRIGGRNAKFRAPPGYEAF